MPTTQRARCIAPLDTTIKSMPAIQENVAAIALLMNQMKLMEIC